MNLEVVSVTGFLRASFHAALSLWLFGLGFEKLIADNFVQRYKLVAGVVDTAPGMKSRIADITLSYKKLAITFTTMSSYV